MICIDCGGNATSKRCRPCYLKDLKENKRTIPQAQRDKIRKSLEGRKYSQERRDNMSKAHMGFKHSEATVQKMRISRSGAGNAAWQGGISYEPYGLEFNAELREQIRKRDEHKCQVCVTDQKGLRRKLSVHHIDYDKKNNKPENLVSLCESCHTATNSNRRYWQEVFK